MVYLVHFSNRRLTKVSGLDFLSEKSKVNCLDWAGEMTAEEKFQARLAEDALWAEKAGSPHRGISTVIVRSIEPEKLAQSYAADIYGRYAHVFGISSLAYQCLKCVIIPSDLCSYHSCTTINVLELQEEVTRYFDEEWLEYEIKIHPVLGEIFPNKVVRI
jgi:hypothetical protein